MNSCADGNHFACDVWYWQSHHIICIYISIYKYIYSCALQFQNIHDWSENSDCVSIVCCVVCWPKWDCICLCLYFYLSIQSFSGIYIECTYIIIYSECNMCAYVFILKMTVGQFRCPNNISIIWNYVFKIPIWKCTWSSLNLIFVCYVHFFSIFCTCFSLSLTLSLFSGRHIILIIQIT